VCCIVLHQRENSKRVLRVDSAHVGIVRKMLSKPAFLLSFARPSLLLRGPSTVDVRLPRGQPPLLLRRNAVDVATVSYALDDVLLHPISGTILSGAAGSGVALYLYDRARKKAVHRLLNNAAIPEPDEVLPLKLERREENELSTLLRTPCRASLFVTGPSGSGISTTVCRVLV